MLANIGSLITLALIVFAFGEIGKGLVVLAWKAGSDGRDANEEDVKRLFWDACSKRSRFVREHRAAAALSVATFLVTWFTGTSFHSSGGYAAVVFAAACIGSSMALRFLRVSTLSTALFIGAKGKKFAPQANFSPSYPHSSLLVKAST